MSGGGWGVTVAMETRLWGLRLLDEDLSAEQRQVHDVLSNIDYASMPGGGDYEEPYWPDVLVGRAEQLDDEVDLLDLALARQDRLVEEELGHYAAA